MRKPLIVALTESALVSKEELDRLLDRQVEAGKPLDALLLESKAVDNAKITEFISGYLNIPTASNILPDASSQELIKKIGDDYARANMVVPLSRTSKDTKIAMSRPWDVYLVDDLEYRLGLNITPLFSTVDEVQRSIEGRAEGSVPAGSDQKDSLGKGNEIEIVQKEEIEKVEEDKQEKESSAPIVELVNKMIIQAIKSRSSDIHIEPEEEKLLVRYRIDGILREAMTPPKRLQPSIISRLKIMSNMDIAEKREPQDGRMKVRYDNREIDIRVSSVPTIYGEKIVLRLLDEATILHDLKSLGFDTYFRTKYQNIITRPYGIVLVTGPTGSGKTTTLYVSLQTINSIEKNIVTIEDPVEYNLDLINQIPINPKAGVTFAKVLRSILRQDPDIIMIGEMRDLETAEIAVRSALTGHLVFSTLHTNDAPGALTRLIDMGIAPYLAASSVIAVLAQRLVRMICPHCKKPYHPTAEDLANTGLDSSQEYTFYRGEGCDKCSSQGYTGRTAVFELMIMNAELREVVLTSPSTEAIRKAAIRGGMKTLWQDGIEKVKQGITTIDEVKKAALKEE